MIAQTGSSSIRLVLRLRSRWPRSLRGVSWHHPMPVAPSWARIPLGAARLINDLRADRLSPAGRLRYCAPILQYAHQQRAAVATSSNSSSIAGQSSARTGRALNPWSLPPTPHCRTPGPENALPAGGPVTVGQMPDAIFDDPRLAAVYDPLDPDRRDLDGYVAIAAEFAAESVIDVGCGPEPWRSCLPPKGCRWLPSTRREPASSWPVANRVPTGVTWVRGTAPDLPQLSADIAVMTANVAQVFLADEEWLETLVAVRRRLRPGGSFAFETRDPHRRAWERWTPEHSLVRVDISGVGVVSSWEEVRRVEPPFVTFDSHTVFHHLDEPDDDIVSMLTLRFRTGDEIRESLRSAGDQRIETRDLFYRPGQGRVFIAHVP